MASEKLIPIRMKKEDMNRADVQAFRCGSKPHEKPLADWIRLHSYDRIFGGTKVWLYRLESNEGPLVGYGSFSTGKLKTTESDGSEREIKAYEIPMLALHEDYWGKPKGCASEQKFSCQIVRHLQQEAKESQKRGQGQRDRLLTLYVHPDAERAQSLYESCGFTFARRFLPDPEIPPEKAAGLLGMDYVW